MQSFSLSRPDGFTYRFTPQPHRNSGTPHVYVREDNPALTIEWEPGWGWCARDPETGLVAGLSVDLPARLQGQRPPVGRWLSAKGEKSYVYDLRYDG